MTKQIKILIIKSTKIIHHKWLCYYKRNSKVIAMNSDNDIFASLLLFELWQFSNQLPIDSSFNYLLQRFAEILIYYVVTCSTVVRPLLKFCKYGEQQQYISGVPFIGVLDIAWYSQPCRILMVKFALNDALL